MTKAKTGYLTSNQVECFMKWVEYPKLSLEQDDEQRKEMEFDNRKSREREREKRQDNLINDQNVVEWD